MSKPVSSTSASRVPRQSSLSSAFSVEKRRNCSPPKESGRGQADRVGRKGVETRGEDRAQMFPPERIPAPGALTRNVTHASPSSSFWTVG